MNRAKTKVLFIIASLKIRGAEKMLINIVNHMNPERFSVSIVSLSNNNPLAKEIHSEAAQFMAFPRKTRFDIQPAQQIRKTIIENQIDVIVAFDIFPFFYIWHALRKIHARPKVFVTIHNSKFDHWKDFFKILVLVRFLSKEDKIISVCNAQAKYWAKTYFISRHRFITIYNGIDCSLYCLTNDLERRSMIRSHLQIPKEAFVILQVASLTREKNHEGALAALKYLVDQDATSPFFLAFVGQGATKREQQLRAMASQLGISDRVGFFGVQTDVKQYYEMADIFTLTSKSTETFSVAALEAMSMGLPGVITNIGGAREMIVDGMNGYLIPHPIPRDIAEKWLLAFENRDHFRRDAIRDRVIQNFSLSDCVQKYERILQK